MSFGNRLCVRMQEGGKLLTLQEPIMTMKEYKVESLIYYTKPFAGKEHIVENSTKEIQEKLDEYAEKGYRLVSTNSTDFGMAVYFYLYFEKDV